MAHKLINTGEKGKTGRGTTTKHILVIEHKTLPLGKAISFWANPIMKEKEEKEITSEQATNLLLNLEERQSDTGKYMIWNGQ
jgi:hypothetical protein